MKRTYMFGGAALVAAVAMALGTTAITGCGKKKSSSPAPASTELSDGAAIAIAGKLSLTGTSTGLSLTDVDVSTLSVYCVTFSNPPVAGTGTVAADGSFSLTLAAAQQAVGCFILQGEDQLGTIVFKNPAKKTLAGTAKTEQRQAFAGDTNLGTISLNLATGQAEVDVTQIVTKLKDTTAANVETASYDFSGSYSIQPVTFGLPTGYVTACAAGTPRNDCRGPMSGEPLWMKRITGKFVADSKPAYGIMIWESEAKFTTCGSKLGFTYADAIANGGIDLSASGVAEGAFTWASGWTDGWKSPTATLRWAQMKTEKATIGGYAGQKQHFSKYQSCTWNNTTHSQSCNEVASGGYSFNGNSDETGCKKADGTPYQLQNWQGMQCTPTALGSGLMKNSCTKTVDSTVGVVTCVNIGGMFDSNGNSLNQEQGTWNMARFPQDYVVYGTGPSCPGDQYVTWSGNSQACSGGGTLTPGAACSTMAETDEPTRMAKLRCYSDSYWQLAETASKAGSCVRQVQPNWNADSSADFIRDNGPSKAQGEHIFEAFEYDSATSGSFRSQETRYEGIQVGNNFDSCEVIESMTFSMRKATDSTNLIVEMIQEQRNISTKPACVAYYSTKGRNGTDGNVSIQKMMFTMVKQ
jgi:hypothetical protein